LAAVGSAASAVFAGRLVSRCGRRLTVGGLALVAACFMLIALVMAVFDLRTERTC
jgi:predicted MFS family arabinose efflux permease